MTINALLISGIFSDMVEPFKVTLWGILNHCMLTSFWLPSSYYEVNPDTLDVVELLPKDPHPEGWDGMLVL